MKDNGDFAALQHCGQWLVISVLVLEREFGGL